MNITFLGTGTSQGVPVIACNCAVCRSVDKHDKRLRSSILIEYNDKNIVVDTGPDFRWQMLRENVQHLEAVLMTHAHKDHIAGLDDVRAFNYQQQQSIPIFSTHATHESLRREFYYAFSEHKYPGIPQLELEEIEAGKAFELFDKDILPIEVMHYKMPVLGFRIDDFAYVTDAKTISEESMGLLKGVKVLVLNALQQEPHISHLTMNEAIAIAQSIKPEVTYLTHISHRFGTHEEIRNLLPDDIKIAYDGLKLWV
ncbi:MBL fold metallo-hydrolase [Sphingobacterium hungaricum]|uniref:MBL fold metallo-hydrolase n=1 Tax=Sphingobacterium hungaricum TaxID=2082723 RepID=A0A928UX67_9SPHI|nr:MBL fold metallo-hydrolase [Sphingobacterium hungaricum]MBE8712412.1 MBL fold metallo-hydrolase [Sphingobacterium hungaricum]